MRKAVASLFASLAIAACVGSDPNPSSSTPTSEAGTSTPGDDAGNGGGDGSSTDGAVVGTGDAGDAGDASTCIAPSAPARILFLNKGGGVYTAGNDDSRTNKSAIVDSSYSVTAWSPQATVWQTLVDCVKGKLAPFNVSVTDVDPGASAEHVEIAFAQAAFFNQFAASSPSVGPLTCGVAANAIGFVSQTHAETSPANGCSAATQLYGYAMGLEAVSACPDAMTFDYTSCNDAAFSKVPLSCGTTAPANCQCATGTMQTSYNRMLAVLGPRCL
jgi:hypothetical protein